MLAFFNRKCGGIVPASLSPNRFKKQDGMLAFFWYRLEFPYQKCLKNKTECSPLFCSSFLVQCLRFSYQKCVKNKTECSPFFWYGASDVLTKNVKKSSDFCDFGGPGVPLAPFGWAPGPGPRFSTNFGRIWGVILETLGHPWAPMCPPFASLRRPLPRFCDVFWRPRS